MKINNYEARALRELLLAPKIGLPEYAIDLQTQRRVGSILSGIFKRHPFPIGDWRDEEETASG